MNRWLNGTVFKITKWTKFLFSIIIRAPIKPFSAGQFNQLAMINTNGKTIQRAYSYVNSPNNCNLEFYITLIPQGTFTNYLYKLKPGDNILINKNSFGFFTIDNIHNCDILWMFASGTGIGPFLSILQEGTWVCKFKKIILIHSVKYVNDLTYISLINHFKKLYKNRFIFEAITSQEYTHRFLHGRITDFIHNNQLEIKIGYEIQPKTSHVMICGNPNMVKHMKLLLQTTKKLRKNLKKTPGQITTENYW
ncbi:MAG: ferredoxin--NADP reductase [Buchnera aphidicola (Eriosoma harunire)]